MSYSQLRDSKRNKSFLLGRSVMADPELKEYKIKQSYTQKFISKYLDKELVCSSFFDRSWKRQSKRKHQYKEV